MLAASYGLVLHGSGVARAKAGMHYIAVNLVASFLFLIGVSLIYGVTAGALFYLVSSTLAVSAFFLLIELVERGRAFGADLLAVTREAFGYPDDGDLEEKGEIGLPVPATMAVLGISFLSCAVLLAGLPPLSGFVAKFALLSGLLHSGGPDGANAVSGATWVFVALLILSGLAALIAMTRAGIAALWDAEERVVPRVSVIEMAPVAGLLLLCLAMTVQAGPIMAYMEATARSLHNPSRYMHDMLSAPGHGRLEAPEQ
jgi:multicomponent K+:H+ antiporter subunit D